MKQTCAGSPAGKGAVHEWKGNSKAGMGCMETIGAAPTATIIKLDFIAPFAAHNIARFTAQPAGGETLLTCPGPWRVRLLS